MRGATFYICVGKRGYVGLKKDGPSIRLGLGWISISFSLIDLEIAIQDVNKYVRHLEHEVSRLKRGKRVKQNDR